MSSSQNGPNALGSMRNENYLNVLKNENIELDNKLKKVNQLVSKLKIQIAENEKEKNKILTTSNQKELDLQNIKKQLEQTKSQVDELKNKNKEKIISLTNQNDLLKNNAEMNTNTIAELQQKITDLEFKLKSNPSNSKKKFLFLANAHNCSLAFEGSPQKNYTSSLPDIIGIKFENKSDNKNDNLFLTGRNELIEMKENNQKLLEQLNILQEELDKHQSDKNNLNSELEKYNKEKKDLMDNLNKKDEIINSKMNQENELNSNLMKQLIENKKIKSSLDNIKIKCKNLEKDKKELEDVILEQENKVNELSSSVKKIIEMMNLKNSEINNNKIYIKNLEETIRDLNKEFRNMRIKKKKQNTKEIVKLKTELDKLKRENVKLLENNQSSEFNRNYKFIPIKNNNNIHMISRNIKIKNEIENKQKYKRFRIKSNVYNNNQSNNRIISSAVDISNFINNQKNKKQGQPIHLHLNRKKNFQREYIYNYNISPKKNGYDNFNGNKNLNIINLNNIRIKNLGNLKYNKSVLDLHKLNKKNENTPDINGPTNKNINIKLDSEDSNIKRIKIRKINSINNLPSNVSDDRTSNTDNTNKNYVFQTKSANNNLIKLKGNNELSNNEKVEKEKIQEFKNLLQQIVSDFDSQ